MRIFYLSALFFFSISYHLKAQTITYGCRIGDIVYTDYLGQHNPDGNQIKYVFKKPGTNYTLNYNGWSDSKPNHENYICGQVNQYDNPVYRHEMTPISDNTCVTESTLGARPIDYGHYVYISINNTSKCSPMPTPLDNHVIFLLSLFGVIGAYFLKKHLIFNIEA